jgi:hypothetical protein
VLFLIDTQGLWPTVAIAAATPSKPAAINTTHSVVHGPLSTEHWALGTESPTRHTPHATPSTESPNWGATLFRGHVFEAFTSPTRLCFYFYCIFGRFVARRVQKHHFFWGRFLSRFWAFFSTVSQKLHLWRFCAFLNKGVQKHHKKLFGGSPCQKLLAKKMRGGKTSLSFLSFDFFIACFGRFSA